ncbi:HdeD family acid-resistance protein [Brevundimonas lenta]|uniref:Uncharacterized membrane protein HdeD (DUF308 family) n=1 Tax=Brevundimonas lenta TaxID=424796 RepID=A0A7W6NQ59_9CAUL|nr:HdeD family acid-resistance protein [Brevundimonas lenta]MBB4083538.1 uncharacterized membrane protein HdeD (DUF308 family) [Brevundimonas lenta]
MSNSSGADAGRFPFESAFLTSAWWALLLRGLLSIVFGILVFTLPGHTLLGLVFFYGAYAIIDGLFSIGGAFKSGASGRTMLFLSGLISIVAGLAAMAWPGLTAVVFVWILAFWSVARGLTEIFVAIRLRKEISNEWMLILAGVISVLFGIALFSSPAFGVVVILWMIGAWALLFGILLVILSFRLRSHRRKH